MSDISKPATAGDLERLVERVDQRFTQVFEFLEQFSATTAGYFQKIEDRLGNLETSVTGLEGHMRGLELRIDRLEACVQSGFSGVNERLRRLEAA